MHKTRVSIIRKIYFIIFEYQLSRGESEGGALGTASALLSIVLFLNFASFIVFFENIIKVKVVAELMDLVFEAESLELYIFFAYLVTNVLIIMHSYSSGNIRIAQKFFEENFENKKKLKKTTLSYLIISPVIFFSLVFSYMIL